MNDTTIDLQAFHRFLNGHSEPRYPIDDRKLGAMMGHITKLFGDDYRKKFMSWAFGAETPEARKNLAQPHRAALWDWLSPTYDEASQSWTVREQCQRTANALMAQWQEDAGQQGLFDELDQPVDEQQKALDYYLKDYSK